MKEIQVEEYCRTKDGRIIKFNKFGTLRVGCTNPKYYKTIVSGRSHYRYDDIVKHSKNIIDLIEVGDFVNGNEITEILQDPFVKGQINLWTDIELRDVYGDYERLKYICDDIKSIVTKERFENSKYILKKEK